MPLLKVPSTNNHYPNIIGVGFAKVDPSFTSTLSIPRGFLPDDSSK
ncbi:11300_t:CDS:2 [Scutellospora calospora]|uniref:11300_t:CDS:1 n=1 Tax=Scutellospora calospora TaxID=85575 RepID=A0ACA9K0D7_9GLOM|nr:11300_t:CDS:2 [Scutellospora calospora]